MISPYLKIKRIEFVITYNCTGRCLHCSVGSCLNRSAEDRHVRADEAVAAVRRLAELYEVQSLMTFGGEPLMYPDITCAIHHTAAECGIASLDIITNGYFSNNEDIIHRIAEQLGNAGVTKLLLSVDAFHQERIPFEPVYSFARSIKQLGQIGIKLSPAWLVNKNADNEWNARTHKLLERFIDLDIPVGNGNDIFMAGNAIDNLAGYYSPPPDIITGKCGEMPYTSPLTDIDSISIEPDGSVVACAFKIGNIYRESIDDIVARYDPFTDETMRAVMDGVPAMLALAEKRGIRIDRSKCYSVCDICRALNV